MTTTTAAASTTSAAALSCGFQGNTVASAFSYSCGFDNALNCKSICTSLGSGANGAFAINHVTHNCYCYKNPASQVGTRSDSDAYYFYDIGCSVQILRDLTGRSSQVSDSFRLNAQ
jgi:hypothetical protein